MGPFSTSGQIFSIIKLHKFRKKGHSVAINYRVGRHGELVAYRDDVKVIASWNGSFWDFIGELTENEKEELYQYAATANYMIQKMKDDR
jgi:hypothetical protein